MEEYKEKDMKREEKLFWHIKIHHSLQSVFYFKLCSLEFIQFVFSVI